MVHNSCLFHYPSIWTLPHMIAAITIPDDVDEWNHSKQWSDLSQLLLMCVCAYMSVIINPSSGFDCDILLRDIKTNSHTWIKMLIESRFYHHVQTTQCCSVTWKTCEINLNVCDSIVFTCKWTYRLKSICLDGWGYDQSYPLLHVDSHRPSRKDPCQDESDSFYCIEALEWFNLRNINMVC